MNFLSDNELKNSPYYYIHIPKCGGHSVIQSIGYNIYKDRHIMLQDLVKIVGYKNIKRKEVFTVVRNPWDRLVSWFFFLKKDETKTYGKSFKDWVLGGCKVHWSGPDPLNMQNYITSTPPIKVNVFKLENINKFYEAMMRRGIQNSGNIKINEGIPRPNYRTFYDKTTMEIIRNRYRRDIIEFGYEF